MSRMTKGSMAAEGSATASAKARRKRRSKGSAGEEAIDVVVEGEEGESEKKCQAETLSDFHRPFRHRTPSDDFGEIIHQVPTIEERNRQQIENPEAHAHESQEAHGGDPAQHRGLPGIVGDGDGTREVLPGNVALDHASQHLQAEDGEVVNLVRRLAERGDRLVTHDRRHALVFTNRLRRRLDTEQADTAVAFAFGIRGGAKLESPPRALDLEG